MFRGKEEGGGGWGEEGPKGINILESGLGKAKLVSSATFKHIFYSHGQKSWDTFAIPGHFPIHTCPTPSLPPQTMLDACIQNFFHVSTLYGLEEGQMKKISKRLHCFMREPRYCRKLGILHYCPGLLSRIVGTINYFLE